VVLRGRHLREYKRMIVALYRVPGSAALNRRFENPLDQLRHRLGNVYGPALKPQLETRSHNRSGGARWIAVARGAHAPTESTLRPDPNPPKPCAPDSRTK
jgi:hypothetical protein